MQKKTQNPGGCPLTLLLCLSLFIPHFCQAEEDLDHQSEAKTLSLVISSGDPEWLMGALHDFWEQEGGRFPRIIATQPGPLELAAGQRLLPNEIVPRVTIPTLLIVASFGNLQVSNELIAVVRSCLANQVAVWVVGSFPEEFLDLGLVSGQALSKIPDDQICTRLEQFFAKAEPKPPEDPTR